jgi:hypothetical protein
MKIKQTPTNNYSVDVEQWQDQHADLVNELEAYKGNDQLVINMCHELLYWGTLSDNQVKNLKIALNKGNHLENNCKKLL